MTEYSYNVNKNCIEKNGNFVAYVDVIDTKRIVDLLNEQDKKIKELDKYCTACDDTLLTIQELTYKLLTIDFKDVETKIDYCHLLNELDNKDLSFIHDCIKSINKCDLLEMEKLKREYGDIE